MAALAAVESLAGLLAPLIFNQVRASKPGRALRHARPTVTKSHGRATLYSQVFPATIHSMPSATFGVGCGALRGPSHVNAPNPPETPPSCLAAAHLRHRLCL